MSKSGSKCRTSENMPMRKNVLSAASLFVRRRLCSGCGRWPPPGVFTLTNTKRSQGSTACADSNVGNAMYCSCCVPANLLARCNRPLSQRLDEWYRTVAAGHRAGDRKADVDDRAFQALGASVSAVAVSGRGRGLDSQSRHRWVRSPGRTCANWKATCPPRAHR